MSFKGFVQKSVIKISLGDANEKRPGARKELEPISVASEEMAEPWYIAHL